MGSLTKLAILLLFMPGVVSQLDLSVCNQTKADSSGPALPSLPEQFTMQVEVNVLNKNFTADVTEWHDGPGNRGASVEWIMGFPIKNIYSYSTNEIFNFADEAAGNRACRVSPLNATNQPYLYGVQTTSGNISFIYSSARALSFDGELNEIYLGHSSVRGMVTDVWRSCVFWPELQATMSVVWYFTVPSWKTPIGLPQVPVRCEVTGKRHDQNGSPTFHHQYEVTEFRSYIDGGVQVFETPAGTICPGRKQTMPLPDIPDLFWYNTEVINVEEQFIQHLKKAYDGHLKLAMLEFSSAQVPYTRLRIIDDFNTGVSYTLDIKRGNCSISTIDPVGFDAISDTSGLLRMRTPKEFFFDLQTNHTYEGIRYMRGLKTEVWLSKRLGWPPSNPTDTTWEYYFAMPELIQNEVVSTASRIPVSIHIIYDTMGVHQMYNLYDFHQDDPLIWDYTISSCFDARRSTKQLQLRFPVTQAQMTAVVTNQNSFRRALVSTITSLVSISPVRINDLSIRFAQSSVDVTLVLVDKVDLPFPVVKYPLQEVDVNTAFSRLQEAISQNIFVVTLNTTAGLLILVPKQDGMTDFQTSTQSAPNSATSSSPLDGIQVGGQRLIICSSQSGGFTTGDIGAAGVGSAFASYLLLLSVLTVWTRYRGASVAYHRERLEMS